MLIFSLLISCILYICKSMVINIFSLSLLSLSLSLSIGHWLWHPCSLTHYLIMFMLSIMFKNYLKSQLLTKVLPIFSLIISKSCLTETEMLQFWRNFVIICPSNRQLPVQPVPKISSKWHFRSSVLLRVLTCEQTDNTTTRIAVGAMVCCFSNCCTSLWNKHKPDSRGGGHYANFKLPRLTIFLTPQNHQNNDYPSNSRSNLTGG